MKRSGSATPASPAGSASAPSFSRPTSPAYFTSPTAASQGPLSRAHSASQSSSRPISPVYGSSRPTSPLQDVTSPTAASQVNGEAGGGTSDPGAGPKAGKPRLQRRPSFFSNGSFRRISRVEGTVVSARGLANVDTWSKSDPYCVVKGIRSNNHLVDIFVTKVLQNTLHPGWDEYFSFPCPESWGLVDLVGLKFFVYDSDDNVASFMGSDDFLGGADVDLSENRHGYEKEFERELEGGPQKKSKVGAVFKKRRPRLVVRITIYQEYVPTPMEPPELLRRSLASFTRVTHIECTILKAKHLRNADLRGKSDPQCIVRVIMLDGQVCELYRTKVINDNLDPAWNESFTATFTYGEEPVVLVFDVFDDDGGQQDIIVSGDHLGSGFLALHDLEAGGRHRVELLGESQLLETRLTKEGRYRGKQQQLEARGAGALSRLRNFRLGQRSKGTLTVHCTAARCVERMPHLELLDNPQDLKDDQDAEEVLPGWEGSMFSVPQDIRRLQTEVNARPGRLFSEDKIVFVSGMLHGASALMSMDTFGKSDPFCIVEGLSNNGHRIFIHRTRYIQDCQSPVWKEAFHLAVPEDEQVHKLLLSVYDSDEGEVPLQANAEDDYLGSATIDLSYLVSDERIQEDVPLVGVKARHTLGERTVTSSFRRNASISVEIRVERRMQPIFQPLNRDPRDQELCQRHKMSRDADTALYFFDPSQINLDRPPSAPGKVLHLRTTNQLLAQARRQQRRPAEWLELKNRGWRGTALTSPTAAPQAQPALASGLGDDPASGEEEREQQRLRAQAAEDLYSFARPRRAPAVQRPASLPDLHTRFGKTGTGARGSALGAEWHTGLDFRSDAEAGAGALMRGMRQKPPLQLLTHVQSAPPGFSPAVLRRDFQGRTLQRTGYG